MQEYAITTRYHTPRATHKGAAGAALNDVGIEHRISNKIRVPIDIVNFGESVRETANSLTNRVDFAESAESGRRHHPPRSSTQKCPHINTRTRRPKRTHTHTYS